MATADLTILRNALPTLEVELRDAYEDLSGLESNLRSEHEVHYDEEDAAYAEIAKIEKEWFSKHMAARAERLARVLATVLEAANLDDSRRSLLEALAGLSFGQTEWLVQMEALHSPALSLLRDAVDSLKAIAGTGLTQAEEDAIRRTEEFFASIPHIIDKQGKVINSEADLQTLVDQAMELLFSGEYQSKPEIGGLIKGFRADGGVRKHGIALELKFARSAEDVKRCIEEFAADIAGYRGSKDWKHFYAVLLMSGPFITPSKFQAELNRMEAKEWKGFALHLGQSKVAKIA